MHTPHGVVTFLNVYNDPRTHAAVNFLRDRVDRLPPIQILAGDFNLHHQMWGGEQITHEQRAHAEELIDLACGDLNLHLCNIPGQPTWESNNTRL